MSTAGKVLTVLILLVMVGWIIMLSAVTQLNVNWAQKVAAQQKSPRPGEGPARRAPTSRRSS